MAEEKSRWNISKAIIGIICIFIGLVYVGVYVGIFDWTLWLNLWRMWPLILVAAGFALLFQRKISGIILLVIFIGISVFGFWMLWKQSEFQSAGAVLYREVHETLHGDTDRAKLSVELARAMVMISGPSDTNTLATGRVETKGVEHTWSTASEGATRVLSVQAAGPTRPFVSAEGFVELQMTQNLPLEMKFAVGSLDATFDFTSIKVERLDINAGAVSALVQLGDAVSEMHVSVSTSSGTIRVTAPSQVGVQFMTSGGLISTQFDGLDEAEGGIFVSPEFDNATSKVYITIDAAVASIEFTRV